MACTMELYIDDQEDDLYDFDEVERREFEISGSSEEGSKCGGREGGEGEEQQEGAEHECPLSRYNSIEETPISPCSMREMPPEFPTAPTTLEECENCGRTFNQTAVERHRKVCHELSRSAKGRKSFSSAKQRQEGIDLKRISGISRDDKKAPKRKSSWREKHQEFLKTIRAAKKTDDDGSPSSSFVPSDYIQCPHCQRHFGPKAADRHISWCAEQKTRFRTSSISGDQEATTRLKTRTKYTPPKPGHSGWRAPKKTDVISSIPPPNVGPNITPQGRLLSPPPPSHRQISPPPQSPGPRRASAQLPPSPYSQTRSNSLGRAAGRAYAQMLHSVSGGHHGNQNHAHQQNGGGGANYGYGNSAVYGAPTSYQNTPFNRSASLRLPRRKNPGGKMARHRDLASDMMASVSIGGKSKRMEPEGMDEADNMKPYHSRRSSESMPYKLEDAPYDPFSAAEMQFQDLLKPSLEEQILKSRMMGSTGSLKNVGLRRDSSDYSPARYKARSSALQGPSSLSLCSLGLDSLNLNSLGRDGLKMNSMNSSEMRGRHRKRIDQQEDSSEAESPPIGGSPTDFQSPTEESKNILNMGSRYSPRTSPSRMLDNNQNDRRSSNESTDTNDFKVPRLQDYMNSATRGLDGYKYSANANHDGSRGLDGFKSSRIQDYMSMNTSNRSGDGVDSPRSSRSRSLCSQSSRSECPGGNEDTSRRSSDGSRWTKSPTPPFTSGSLFSFAKKEKSPDLQSFTRSSLDYKIKETDSDLNEGPSDGFSWTSTNNNTSTGDSFIKSPSAYRRYLGSSASKGLHDSSRRFREPGSGSTMLSTDLPYDDPLKALRTTIEEELKAQNLFDRLENTEPQGRTSSGSSTDSSLPPLSSPSSTSPLGTTKSSFTSTPLHPTSTPSHTLPSTPFTPKFCYECGSRYPTSIAKFCCHCGARRAS